MYVLLQGGVLWAYYPPEQVVFITNEHTTVYTRDETIHKHHCAICRCSTHNELRCTWGENGPDFTRPQVAVNARLFDDFDLAAVRVEHLNGRNLW